MCKNTCDEKVKCVKNVCKRSSGSDSSLCERAINYSNSLSTHLIWFSNYYVAVMWSYGVVSLSVSKFVICPVSPLPPFDSQLQHPL